MKISIKNFGPIDHFEFDLEKDLHVIYGENNIGKSYATSAIYLILKHYMQNFMGFNYAWFSEYNFDSFKKTLYNNLSKIDTTKEFSIDITDTVKDLIMLVLSNVYLPLINNSIKNNFPTRKLLSSIVIRTKTFSVEFKDYPKGFLVYKIDVFEKYYLKREDFFHESKNSNWSDKVIVSFEGKEVNMLNNIFESIEFEIKSKVSRIFLHSYRLKNSSKPTEIFFLPSSRSGLYQGFNNLGRIFAKLSQWKYRLNERIELPDMQESVSDYFLNLNSIREGVINKKLNPIAEKLEKLLEIEVKYNHQNSKIEVIDKKNNITFDLSEASSMLSEISPLILHIRSIMGVPQSDSTMTRVGKDRSENEGKILFIEEPEAHLHPKVQVEMMKIFVELAKSGVKVVMTTHSDFMMNELSNALLSKEIDAKKVASYHLKMGEKGSFDAGDMKATNEGIEDYNFTDVAVEQYERRMAILEKLNQDAIRQD